ncbi:hypothetical protein PI125_g20015 [Phytophthora idaei]|nr:hypothetical protein PI125_g20015 [Phytophthora idaei]KAG3150221.1 hypothetical protein PI126_g11619 [Phytophthora idaei]
MVPTPFYMVSRQPHGVLADEGYVRVDSAKYCDWQVLAYETALDKDLLQKEQRLYDEWLSRQPPAVERREYPIPTAAARRPQPEGAAPELTCADLWAKIDAAAEANTPTVGSGADIDMAHTRVSGSDSKILNAAVGPCDAEAILNAATTVFDPNGDRSDSEWAERCTHTFEDANLENGIQGPSNTSSMDASTGFPVAVNLVSAQGVTTPTSDRMPKVLTVRSRRVVVKEHIWLTLRTKRRCIDWGQLRPVIMR